MEAARKKNYILIPDMSAKALSPPPLYALTDI